MFHRESQKCLKEKKTFVDKAKKCLQQGNEEGARLFLESANNKDSESMKYLKIANRLEALSAKVGGNFKTQDLMNHLTGLVPFLDEAAEKMPLDLMYTRMAAFEQAYDQMTVKGKMVSEAIDNNLAEKGSVANTDKMMHEIKAELAHEMGQQYIAEPTAAKQEKANNDYYEQLKKI